MQNQILQLVNPAIALIFAIAFAVLWFGDRSRRHTALLSAAHLLMAAAFVSFHFGPDPNSAASVLVMHTLCCAAIICLLRGAAVRVDARYSLALPAVIAIGFGAIILLTTEGDDHMPRIIAGNTCYGLLLALGAQVLNRAASGRGIDRLVVWMFGLTAAQFFIQPYLTAIFEGAMSSAEYRASSAYALVSLNIGIWSLMLALTLVGASVLDRVEAIKADSESDLLTGLVARKAFERDAVSLLDEAQGQGICVSVIVADIDHFKRVNDMWGHQVGDQAIAAFGALLAQTVRASDRVGRVGGEEFCILVWNCEGDEAARLAERIRDSFARLVIDGLPDGVHLSASFGVAEWLDGEGYGRLFARADAALYAAKNAGRDRVEGPREVTDLNKVRAVA
ncbi:GGDEF domain-containing protein [Qipengyuania sp. MTN3-11]|uniref:GGDEF domain-containing protein n=1 Tax=Qipengyuania sp. MTN3-11 TaxID=3056557 RepID=UPI0036F30800